MARRILRTLPVVIKSTSGDVTDSDRLAWLEWVFATKHATLIAEKGKFALSFGSGETDDGGAVVRKKLRTAIDAGMKLTGKAP